MGKREGKSHSVSTPCRKFNSADLAVGRGISQAPGGQGTQQVIKAERETGELYNQ